MFGIKKQVETSPGCYAQMMIALGANIMILGQRFLIQHGVTAWAFLPDAFGHRAALALAAGGADGG